MASLTKNIRRPSEYSQGGIVLLMAFPTFLANGVTPNATYTDGLLEDVGKIDLIVLADTNKCYALEFDEDKASFAQPLQVGNNRHIKQTLAMQFMELDTEKNAAVKAFDLAKHTYAVKTRTGKYWLLGKENGMQSETNESGSGAAAADLNGYNITVAGFENGRAVELTAAAWASLVALVAADV